MTPPKRDLPWGRMALVITGVFLVLLVERSVRHEPEYDVIPIEILRPRGVVDDLSPIVWDTELPDDAYRFVVVVRDGEIKGEGELLRSPFLTENRWELPEGVEDEWGHVRIRVYLVDPTRPAEELLKRTPMRSNEVVAWERE